MPEPLEAVWEEVAHWPFRAPDAGLADAWGKEEWQGARRAVLVHGIAPLLGAMADFPERFSSAPAGLIEYLAAQAAWNSARVSRISGELEKIMAAAIGAGISVLPLKGGALLEGNLLPVALRPLNDLDFLVREADRDAFEKVLTGLAYELTEHSPRHREFTCLRFGTEVVFREGEHPDNPILVEVHTWIGQEMFSAVRVDITEAMWRGGTTRRAVMLHLALHAGANAAKRRLRLVQLIDLAQLAPQLDAEDWAWIEAECCAPAAEVFVETALRLAGRFAGCESSLPMGRCNPDLDALLTSAPLHAFSHLAGPATLAWEIQWISGWARWVIRFRRTLPAHRLLMGPTRLRERYQLPLDAHPARAYAMHFSRAVLWPAIVLLRLMRGTR